MANVPAESPGCTVAAGPPHAGASREVVRPIALDWEGNFFGGSEIRCRPPASRSGPSRAPRCANETCASTRCIFGCPCGAAHGLRVDMQCTHGGSDWQPPLEHFEFREMLRVEPPCRKSRAGGLRRSTSSPGRCWCTLRRRLCGIVPRCAVLLSSPPRRSPLSNARVVALPYRYSGRRREVDKPWNAVSWPALSCSSPRSTWAHNPLATKSQVALVVAVGAAAERNKCNRT